MPESRGPSGTGRPCVYCEGCGCEECDQTGRRYREGFDVDGTTVTVSGSGDGLKPELREAFTALAKAVIAQMADDSRRCSRCGAALSAGRRHKHEKQGWRPLFDDLEGVLEGYEVDA